MIVKILWGLIVAGLVAAGAFWGGLNLQEVIEEKLEVKGCHPLSVDVVTPAPPTAREGTVRFVALGDQGTGDDAQRAVAGGIAKVCAGGNCDFLVLLGDSFYPDGLASADDPLIQKAYEDILAPLGLPAFAVLGNHDAHQHPLPLVLHSLRSDTWRMPNYAYTFRAGPARFIALNTNCSLLAWESVDDLMDDTADSTDSADTAAPAWNIVLGHHSIYSNGPHGDIDSTSRWVWRKSAGSRVDFLLSGHNHTLEHLRAKDEEDPTEYVISGAGGVPGEGKAVFGETEERKDDESSPSKATSLFRLEDGGGFVWIELSAAKATVRYHGRDGRELYRFEKTPR